MGMVVEWPHHARTSTGYKSGRSSWRETPLTFSTAKTRKGGTSSHCETACGFMPSDLASEPTPPDLSIARCSAASLSFMKTDESTALKKNQVPLGCTAKAMLYAHEMLLKDRIRYAIDRRNIAVDELAELLAKATGKSLSPQAIYQWQSGKTGPHRDKIPILEAILKLPAGWLQNKDSQPLPPLGPDDLEIFLERLLEVGKAIPEGQRGPAMLVLKALIPSEPKQPKSRQKAS